MSADGAARRCPTESVDCARRANRSGLNVELDYLCASREATFFTANAITLAVAVKD